MWWDRVAFGIALVIAGCGGTTAAEQRAVVLVHRLAGRDGIHLRAVSCTRTKGGSYGCKAATAGGGSYDCEVSTEHESVEGACFNNPGPGDPSLGVLEPATTAK